MQELSNIIRSAGKNNRTASRLLRDGIPQALSYPGYHECDHCRGMLCLNSVGWKRRLSQHEGESLRPLSSAAPQPAYYGGPIAERQDVTHYPPRAAQRHRDRVIVRRGERLPRQLMDGLRSQADDPANRSGGTFMCFHLIIVHFSFMFDSKFLPYGRG